MRNLKINKMNEEWLDKLANALPIDVWGTYLLAWKKSGEYYSFNLSDFVKKIQAQELEFQKIRILKSDSREKSKAATDEVTVKSKEIVQEVEEQVKEISAIKVEKKARKMSEKCSKCDKSKADNVKTLKRDGEFDIGNQNFERK
ncbi:hypothetical protein HanHA300_Chr14g0511751 [Helianthus annuus]|nr:hypothetical protein HanHA300_Chr14g0511751 [Helianthus annuus]KAJ0484500.1 hypothetical protein HanHA89_Chr14g0544791 [Helianthus annuus]KAJ0655055.1 hypothetical protein HanLR1_Chr14g0514081 [Helianthus annuus]